MKTISMLELRQNAEEIVRRAQRGQRMVLTYRGKPVMRLEPIVEEKAPSDDPFYKLHKLASTSGAGLTNDKIDEIVYGL